MYRNYSGSRRFTLIELLVVIAIIAILMAMLLPALSIDYETRGDVRSLGSNSLANAGSPELWRCLSNKNHGWRYEALSYGYNNNLGYYDQYGVPFGSGVTANRRRLTHPSSLIVLGDGDGDMEYDTIINGTYYVLGSRHSKGAIVSYADSHIDWILQRDSFRTGVAWDGVHWNGGSWDAKSYLMWGVYGYHSK